MRHSWISTLDGYVCIVCNLHVDPQPFDDGYYPLECDPPERGDAHRHYIVPSIRGGECYYCSQTFGG